MSRVVRVTIITSAVLTAAVVPIDYLAHASSETAHVWADMFLFAAVVSWLAIVLVWGVERLVLSAYGAAEVVGQRVDHGAEVVGEKVDGISSRLGVVEAGVEAVQDVVDQLDDERIQARTVVLSILKNNKGM